MYGPNMFLELARVILCLAGLGSRFVGLGQVGLTLFSTRVNPLEGLGPSQF